MVWLFDTTVITNQRPCNPIAKAGVLPVKKEHSEACYLYFACSMTEEQKLECAGPLGNLLDYHLKNRKELYKLAHAFDCGGQELEDEINKLS